MAMCEHFKRRKLRFREFPVLYAFREIPCGECDYVMYIPSKCRRPVEGVGIVMAVILGILFRVFVVDLINAGVEQKYVFTGMVVVIAIIAYLFAKIGGYIAYSMAYEYMIYED